MSNITNTMLKRCTRSQLTSIWQQSNPPYGAAWDKKKAELVEFLMAHPDLTQVERAYNTIIVGIDTSSSGSATA